MLVSFLLGVTGLLLAGDSIGRACRERKAQYATLAVIELLSGLYFSIAAIGAN